MDILAFVRGIVLKADGKTVILILKRNKKYLKLSLRFHLKGIRLLYKLSFQARAELLHMIFLEI